jgi:hypothetical protein
MLRIVNGRIRNKLTRELLRPDGNWTRNPMLAASFNGILEAASAVHQYKLRGVDFVYLMGGDAAYDIAYELTDYQEAEARGDSLHPA